jgi:hypothetical protein
MLFLNNCCLQLHALHNSSILIEVKVGALLLNENNLYSFNTYLVYKIHTHTHIQEVNVYLKILSSISMLSAKTIRQLIHLDFVWNFFIFRRTILNTFMCARNRITEEKEIQYKWVRCIDLLIREKKKFVSVKFVVVVFYVVRHGKKNWFRYRFDFSLNKKENFSKKKKRQTKCIRLPQKQLYIFALWCCFACF